MTKRKKKNCFSCLFNFCDNSVAYNEAPPHWYAVKKFCLYSCLVPVIKICWDSSYFVLFKYWHRLPNDSHLSCSSDKQSCTKTSQQQCGLNPNTSSWDITDKDSQPFSGYVPCKDLGSVYIQFNFGSQMLVLSIFIGKVEISWHTLPFLKLSSPHKKIRLSTRLDFLYLTFSWRFLQRFHKNRSSS